MVVVIRMVLLLVMWLNVRWVLWLRRLILVMFIVMARIVLDRRRVRYGTVFRVTWIVMMRVSV